MENHEEINDTNLIFTRYLYSKIEVKHSLLIAILNKQPDESLFWLYELYYSGFQHEIPVLLKNIYDEFFSMDNPNYRNAIEKRLTHPCKLNWGEIVTTLCSLEYRVDQFIDTYYGVKCKSKSGTLPKKRVFIIKLTLANVEKYETLPVGESPRLYLKEVCKYSIHKNLNQLFNNLEKDFTHIYKDMNKWIYYASKSPIWLERIEEYGGKVVDVSKQIIFLNEKGEPDEDAESEFWDVWNLETDEQLPEVSKKSTGTKNESQWTIVDFCKKYGGELITKKVKIPVNPSLSNTLTPL